MSEASKRFPCHVAFLGGLLPPREGVGGRPPSRWVLCTGNEVHSPGYPPFEAEGGMAAPSFTA